MQTKTKIGIGVVLVVAVLAVFVGNQKLFKGSLGDSSNVTPGTLTVSRDTVWNSKATQIVSGEKNVLFGAYRFQTTSEDVRIKKITIKNIGSNVNGVVNIGIFTNGTSTLLYDDPTTPANEGVRVNALGGDVTFDYSARPYPIPANSQARLAVQADTVYQATSGQTVQFAIVNVEAEGVSSNEPIVFTGSVEDTPKTFYTTKLNFNWSSPSSGSTLATGQQIEVARFTMGADRADVNNEDAVVTVTGLNFTEFSTAHLTNFTLYDLTSDKYEARNANSSNFTSTEAGGALKPLSFEQGKPPRTFRILADVGTNAGSQAAQFRFNAGGPSSAGSATWSVYAPAAGQTTISTWTVIGYNAADTSSATLIGSSLGSDTRAPTISAINVVNGGSANRLDAGDKIKITFNEKIDPVTINQGLVFGGAVNVDSQSTGGLQTNVVTSGGKGNLTSVRVSGITEFNIKSTVPLVPQDARIRGKLEIDLYGTNVTITAVAVESKIGLTSQPPQRSVFPRPSPFTRPKLKLPLPSLKTTAPSQIIDSPATVLVNVLRDAAGNLLAPGTGPIPTGSF